MSIVRLSFSRVAVPVLLFSPYRNLGAVLVAYPSAHRRTSNSLDTAISFAQHAAHQQPTALFHEE
jgi:hypothetical protein